jgi:hypothetical protein
MVASQIASEFAFEFRYNIRMLGFEVDGPIKLLGDNNAVILNTAIPSSQLKKKHQACAYHRIREAIAGSVINFRHIPSHLNLADIGYGGATARGCLFLFCKYVFTYKAVGPVNGWI